MKITIIADDGVVGIDGQFFKVDLSELPQDVAAVQFNSDTNAGHIEYKAVDGKRQPNADINSVDQYQVFLERWADISVANVDTPEPVLRSRFTSLEFLDRFTEEEQLAVVSATLQNPQIKLWYDKMLAAMYIDLADERTVVGIDALIGAGLISPDRRNELLAPASSV